MLISIIIPVYRSQEYIEKCVRSVFNQTYKDLEIIIVDDCGKNDSIDIVRRVLLEFPDVAPKVRILENDFNKGSAVARKVGMEAATGDYILQIDSDDYVELTMVEKLVRKAQEDDADMVVCNMCYVYTNSRKIVRLEPPADNFDYISKILIGDMHAGVSNKLMRRSILKEHNIHPVPGVNMGDDMTILIQSLMFMNKISFIGDVLYYYNRAVEGSLSKSNYPIDNDIKIINLFEECLKLNKIEDPKVLKSFQMFKIGRLGRNLFCSDLEDVKNNLNVFTFDKKLIMKHKNLPIHYRLIVWYYIHDFMLGVKLLRALKRLKN